ncbi:MAG: SpoVG family protein [Clostridia bacterium]|nr:SpoVG family protein [Clostridia bacterium]
MEITEVKIRRVLDEPKLKALVSIVISDAIAVHDIKIIQGTDRLFVVMPSKKEPSGFFRNIIHPLNSETRVLLEDTIVSAYLSHLNSNA